MTDADALRREADRLEAEGKTRKWGLLDGNHELTDDGSIGRFVALEPDQLRFAAAILELLAEAATVVPSEYFDTLTASLDGPDTPNQPTRDAMRRLGKVVERRD